MNDRNQLYADDEQEILCHIDSRIFNFYITMIKGYQDMAEINLSLSEMSLFIESEVEAYIQQKIAECE
jgi:hypothetical protein